MPTKIQIKRSQSTATPTDGSLANGEFAYSYNSDKLFLGNTTGQGVVVVGGKYFTDTAINAYTQANTAYTQANTVFGQANTARDQANTAYTQANTVFAQANTARNQANDAYTQANAAFGQANTAYTQANNAFLKANNALPLTGGTITGNLNVTGNLFLSGNTYSISANELRIGDSLIYLAGNNYSSDLVDIGFIANYVNATGNNVHTGFYREHTTGEYYLIREFDAEPSNNHIGAIPYATDSGNSRYAILNADLKANSLSLYSTNVAAWITSAFGQTNLAFAQANTVFGQTNLAFAQANIVFAQANTARNQANDAYTQANTVFGAANAASIQASNASFMTQGTVATGRISGSYTGITGVGTLTAGIWNASTIGVPYGGTGMVTFTTNGIVFGNSAGDLKVTAAGTDGQVLQASATGVPQFGMLDGGSF